MAVTVRNAWLSAKPDTSASSMAQGAPGSGRGDAPVAVNGVEGMARRRRRLRGDSQTRAQFPDLRKQHHIQHAPQIAHAARAASAPLEADHALHRGHVAEPPEAEGIFQVRELLAQLVQVPVALRIAIDGKPGGFHCIALGIGLRPVAVRVARGHGNAPAGQQAQCLVVERGRLVGGLHLREQIRPVRVRLEHRRVLVAQRELDAAVLVALEAARLREVGPDGAVLGRCHRGQHVPGMDQLFHDLGHAREHLEGRRQVALGDMVDRGAQLVQHELHPQLAGLVLHDEEHFIVVGRERLLRIQDRVELQVVAIAHVAAEIELRALLVHDGFGLGRVRGRGRG